MTLTWEIAVAMLTIVSAIVGALGWWIRQSIEREAERRKAASDALMTGQTDIKDDLKAFTAVSERRFDRLEVQAKDFRPGVAIDNALDHAKHNLDSKIDAVRLGGDKHALAIESLRDRMTIQETKHTAIESAVSDMKKELRDTRSEINCRFDAMADVQKTQFDQLCASIREISKRDVRLRP